MYILLCSDGSFYTGATVDVEKRLKAHQNGKASAYTRSRRPVKIIFLEKQKTWSAALKREIRIKNLTREQKEALVIDSDCRLRRLKI